MGARDEFRRGERVIVDLTTPYRRLVFPVFEAVIITGVIWAVVGYLDGPSAWVEPGLRNLLVWAWLVLLAWRLGLPAARGRRRRFTVTDRRLLLRPARLTGGSDSIDLAVVRGARRRRGSVELSILGADRPLVIPRVPRARRAVEAINTLLTARASREAQGYSRWA